jgi:hypothetical protein
MADASLREKIFLDRLMTTAVLEQENSALKQEIAAQRATIEKIANEKGITQAQLCDVLAEKASTQARLRALESEKVIWDSYRRSRGWAILVSAWRLREKLIPANSRREVAAKIGYRTMRSLYRTMRSAVERSSVKRDRSVSAPRRAA